VDGRPSTTDHHPDAPFEIEVGWGAILEDPFHNPIGILDLSKGPRRTA
jgi:hypothetical protein